MGKGSAPKAPDPQQTAAAQTATNVATAQANTALNAMNQITPYGSLTYNQTGQQFISDPNGQKYWYDPATKQYNSSLPTRSVTTQSAPTQSSVVRYDKNGQPIYSSTGGGTKTSTQTYTPDGWQQVSGYYVPTYTATQTLSPEQQAIFDQTQAAQLNLGTLANTQSAKLNDLLGQDFNPLATAPAAGTAPELQTDYLTGDVSADRQRVEDALFSRLNTSLDQDRSSLDAKLANQGIKLGSTAYSNAQRDFGQNVNDARTSAILNATQQQAVEANTAAQAAGFHNTALQQDFQNKNTARSNYLTEQYAARSQPINEIAALLSGSQITNPNFVNTPTSNIPTVDYAGLVQQNYSNQMQAYQQQQAQSQSLLGGLFGLGGKLISLSDERAKRDIKPVGELKGHKLYSYRYKSGFDDGQRHIGVMAQEAEKKNPAAVSTRPDGLKQVNYGSLFGLGKAA
ncbi:tail fiber domain-containing protein [Rhizobium leucaenae]|uniref:tail fiber domain-containing protein n=1 Tax=Rhizobium leucaenae TaxID=29450 RepID=UPI001612922A|nr:tail fiber domain-containing protein [Rhizobium leucaenae]MBB6304048.1 hypothetical protein [Rhizobium leucaenae]